MSVPPDYKIFDDFETYYTLDLEVDRSQETNEKAQFCHTLNLKSNKDFQIKNICKTFVNLVAKTNINYSPHVHEQSELNTYYEFMNYWLYYKLKDAGCDEDTIIKFFEKLNQNRNSLSTTVIPMNNIRVIEEKYFNNIHTLYQLYKNCEKLKENNVRYDKFLDELKDKYNEGLKRCFNEADNNFCNALKNFRNNYNSDKIIKLQHCNNQKCRSLPELILEQTSSDKPSRIAIEGFALIGESNAKHSNGLSFITSTEYSNLRDLISLQYNLRMEKDDNEKYCVMMKILHEFFQYCSKNNNNWYLEQFIKEFIKKYYNKKENEYRKLFTSCLSDKKSKPYCTYYDNCKSEFEKDLSLIEKNKDDYIKYKEEHFKKLIPDESWVDKALELFKDSDTILRNLPSITSTLIAMFLCIFFLYKLTPLSSIFRKEKKKRNIPLFYPQRIIQGVTVDNTGYINPKTKKGKIRFAYQPS